MLVRNEVSKGVLNYKEHISQHDPVEEDLPLRQSPCDLYLIMEHTYG